MKTLSFLIACAALAVAAGCSTPQARIKQSPEAYAKLSATDQQLIREGKVAVGFTPDMVRLALGDPDRISTRTDASGVNEAWSYATYETDEGVLLYRGFYHRQWCDPLFYPYYASYPSRRTRDYLKIVFANGLVSVIEQQT
jgi:outer membrane protein assembly factor BamE (lipoprotein component of BamABCDE complex)